MTRSAGSCDVHSSRVVLAERLRHGEREVLAEVLCHELAHLAVHRVHGPGARPHGPEWAVLVEAAGFTPRRRLPDPGHDHRGQASRRPFVHQCPVCHWSRRAGKTMRAWRCPVCREHGLDGHLDVRAEEPRAY